MKHKCQAKKHSRIMMLMLIVFCMLTLFLCCFALNGTQTVYATTTTNAIDELWDSEQSKFNQITAAKLYQALGGGNINSTDFQDKYTDLFNWASTPRTSADFRTNNNNLNVVVTLGGMEWVATYLTQASGNLVLTLMLADSAENLSQFNKVSVEAAYTYTTDSYGSSYIRASLLSGNPAYLNSTSDIDSVSSYLAVGGASSLTAMTEATDLGNEFADFTAGPLSAYILTPAQVGYQESILVGYNASPRFYSTSNDAYGDTNGSAGFYSATFDYYANATVKTETYTRWKNDKLWIPGLAELGLVDSYNGFWKTDSDLRAIGKTYMTRSSGYSSFSGYYYMTETGVMDDNKFAYATTVTSIRPALHLNLSATADTSSSGVKKPTQNTNRFTYNSAFQTYTPVGFDGDFMTITGNVQRDVKIKDGSTTHESDPNGYEVVVSINDGYNWFGNTSEDLKFKFVINKADPILVISYDPPTLPNPMYVSYGLPTLTYTGTAGTISWDANQAPSPSITDYHWTFIPDDEDNFNQKTGTQQLTYEGATATGIKVVVKDNVDIYDRYDTITYASFSDYIKSCISVYAMYNDGSTDSSPLPNSSYNVTTTEAQLLVSSGDSESKQIGVRVTAEGVLQNRTGSVTTTVYKAKIEGMNVYEALNPVTLKYPVTLDQIKSNYEVFLSWNFDTTREIQAADNLISVAVKETDDNPDGIIKVGNIELVFTYSNGGLTATAEYPYCQIEKGDIDMSGVTFDNKSVIYDGQIKSLEVSGTLPDGILDVTYSSTGDNTDVGTYTITATFVVDTDCYNPVADMTATLTITDSGFDMSGISFTEDTVTYDGQPHKLEIEGNLPHPDIVVTYEYKKDGQTVSAVNGVIDAGVYTVIASFSNPDPANYADIPDMTATLTIEKDTFDMSGISFEDSTLIADGEAHTLEISGTLPDSRITVVYTVAGKTGISFTDAGEYVFTAKFVNPDSANYYDIEDMTATLTIEENPNGILPTPEEPSNNGPSFWDKVKAFFNDLMEKHFPLWQVITMAVSALLALIFMIKAIQYGNRAKKAKGETKKIKAKAYATLLPVFASDVVALGLTNKIWSIMAFAFVGLALLMFVIALITRHGWKKAELAKENALEEAGINAQNGRQMVLVGDNGASLIADLRRELQETLTQVNHSGQASDNSSMLEQRLIEMEERRREDEERHRKEMEMLREEQRRENERREEEQAKRDEAMKLMLANMMGRQQGDEGFAYASMDDTDLLVQKVIAGLLPAVQQMMPEPTAYLSAPAYEQSSQNLDELAQMVADRINIPTAVAYDNSSEVTAKIDALQEQIANLGNQANTVVVADNSEDMKAMSDEMNAMREQIAKLSQTQYDTVILDEEDDDFDDEEEWDCVLDEDDEEEFAESVIVESDGTVRKVYPNFRMRLKQSSDKNREWYAAIKNLFCSQKGVTYRVYKRVEKIRYQGNVVAVIGIAKRSIKLWLALKPYEYDARRYHHKDVSDKPRFVDVPLYVRVGSDRALTRAQELILALFQEQAMEARKRYTDRSIQELIFTLKYNKLLTNKLYKRLLCESIHVHDCNALDNETAEKCIERKNVDFIDNRVIETVKLDDIDAKFQDGNRVTLDRLRKVGLVSANCTGYNVAAGQRLTKPLIIVANDFTMEAVKMIALTGGRVIKLTEVNR